MHASTGNGFSDRWGRNGEFCVAVGPVAKTAGIYHGRAYTGLLYATLIGSNLRRLKGQRWVSHKALTYWVFERSYTGRHSGKFEYAYNVACTLDHVYAIDLWPDYVWPICFALTMFRRLLKLRIFSWDIGYRFVNDLNINCCDCETLYVLYCCLPLDVVGRDGRRRWGKGEGLTAGGEL